MATRYIVRGQHDDGTPAWIDPVGAVVFSEELAGTWARRRDADRAAEKAARSLGPDGYSFGPSPIDVPSQGRPSWVAAIESQRDEAQADLAAAREKIAELRRYLLSDKFAGPGNAWVNPRDVLARIEGL
jgi:hypothetical protein